MNLPERKKIRLQGYDYSGANLYFVTACLKNRSAVLWDVGADIIRPQPKANDIGLSPSNSDLYDAIRQGKIPLSPYGEIVKTAIENIPLHYRNVEMQRYCVMPNHIHMLVRILPIPEGERNPQKDGRIISAPTLSTIVGSMKRWSSRQIGFSVWQKSFYDRIIWNEIEYQEACNYIDNNPLKWKEDDTVTYFFNPEALKEVEP
ncbi:MAG: transposase [Oscillospiraceae bacterium]|nr:transposase [Oscillospiraceae bacterium]